MAMNPIQRLSIETELSSFLKTEANSLGLLTTNTKLYIESLFDVMNFLKIELIMKHKTVTISEEFHGTTNAKRFIHNWLVDLSEDQYVVFEVELSWP